MFVCFTATNTQSQILKQLGDRVKGQVKARADRKVDDANNKTIDGATKKPVNKEKTDQIQPSNNKTENKSTGKGPSDVGNNNNGDMTPQDGYIQAKVFPDQTLTGASLVISGETMYSDKLKEVSIVITPPKGAKAVSYKALINKNDGSFKLPFNSTNVEGGYKVRVNSPDGKASKNITFTIYDLGQLAQIGKKVKDLLDEASRNLKIGVAKIKDQAATKDRKEIDEKMKEVEEKIEAGEKMLTSINEACGKLGKAGKEAKGMPEHEDKTWGL
jgi:hypothetical protein